MGLRPLPVGCEGGSVFWSKDQDSGAKTVQGGPPHSRSLQPPVQPVSTPTSFISRSPLPPESCQKEPVTVPSLTHRPKSHTVTASSLEEPGSCTPTGLGRSPAFPALCRMVILPPECTTAPEAFSSFPWQVLGRSKRGPPCKGDVGRDHVLVV